LITEAFVNSFRAHLGDLAGRPILVALSGGSDSVALLRLLQETAPALGCRPAAAHVHHHLRGADADADAAFCGELCRELGVPLAVEHLDPVSPRGASPEAWWRHERYRLLEIARERSGCAAVATAHTLDDQAETVLLKLLRGAGPRGVAAIRRRRCAVVRPVLDLRREELRSWLRSRGASWREDASNLAADRPRAWLRRHVVPLLESAYPRALEQLAAFAAALAEDDAFMAAALAAAPPWPAVGRPVAAAPVAALPPALLRRWLLALADRLPLGEPPSRVQLAAVADMLRRGAPAAVDLGRRWVLRRRGETLHLSPPPCAPFAPVAAVVPSTTPLPGGFVARIGAASAAASHAARLDERVRAAALLWRPARPGERWAGVGGRTLARALAAAGVPPEWRRAWPVLEADGTMIWVPGAGVLKGWDADVGPGLDVGLEVPW
jgi:tRNA(Ile)-lysidine synthase